MYYSLVKYFSFNFTNNHLNLIDQSWMMAYYFYLLLY